MQAEHNLSNATRQEKPLVAGLTGRTELRVPPPSMPFVLIAAPDAGGPGTLGRRATVVCRQPGS